MIKKKLLLITQEFPYGNQETFIEQELPIISGYFDEVVLVPVNVHGTPRKTPGNVRILPMRQTSCDRLAFIYLLWIYIKAMFLDGKYWKYMYHFFAYWRYLKKEACLSSFLKKIIQSEKTVQWTGYSYWFLNGALALSLMEGLLFKRTVSRAHGYDLYEDRQGGHIPFRNFIVNRLNTTITISEHGYNYLRARVRQPEMISLSYLGTLDHGIGPFFSDHRFRIVSCSNLVPVKRVDMIAGVIGKLSGLVEWIHFGDGPEAEKVEKAVSNLKANIRYQFPGRISNEQLHYYFSKNHINLFINLSITEGIPVSMMEAMSYGIPVIGTDVGGVSELITKSSGILINSNSSADEIANLIESFCESSMNTSDFRKGVREHWRKHFRAPDCYHLFARDHLL